MKKFLVISGLVLLAASTAVFAILYYYARVEFEEAPVRIVASADRQWLLSGDKRIFDVTTRSFNVIGLFGFRQGVDKWAPVGGARSAYQPHFVSCDNSLIARDEEYVLGVVNGSVATAYPLRILGAHQVVNDAAQTPPVVACFTNAGRTAAAFAAVRDGSPMGMASSGFLYRNSDLLFSADTDGLFLPLEGRFVSGPGLGGALELLPGAVMTLGAWKKLHPASRLLSDNTGVPNVRYPREDFLYAPPSFKQYPKNSALLGMDIPAERPVVVLRDGLDAVIVPFPAGGSPPAEGYEVAVGGRRARVFFSDDLRSAWAVDASGALIPSLRSTWLAAAWALDYARVVEPR